MLITATHLHEQWALLPLALPPWQWDWEQWPSFCSSGSHRAGSDIQIFQSPGTDRVWLQESVSADQKIERDKYTDTRKCWEFQCRRLTNCKMQTAKSQSYGKPYIGHIARAELHPQSILDLFCLFPYATYFLSKAPDKGADNMPKTEKQNKNT